MIPTKIRITAIISMPKATKSCTETEIGLWATKIWKKALEPTLDQPVEDILEDIKIEILETRK